MTIEHIEFLRCFHQNFKINECPITKNYWSINSRCGLDKISHDGKYTLTMVSTVIKVHGDKIISVDIINEFGLTVSGNIYAPLTDVEKFHYADLMQISLAHGRIIFHQLCEEQALSIPYLRLDPVQKFYEDIKSGAINLN